MALASSIAETNRAIAPPNAMGSMQSLLQGRVVGFGRHRAPAVGPPAIRDDIDANEPRLIGNLRKRQDHHRIQQRERCHGDRHADREAADDPTGVAGGMPEGADGVTQIQPEHFEPDPSPFSCLSLETGMQRET
jgi:hypothetical protein